MQITIGTSQTSQPQFVPPGAIVTVTPAAGAVAKVEYTKGTAADIANGVAAWAEWEKGAVSAPASDLADQAVFIRVSPTGGGATVSVDESPNRAAISALNGDWGAAMNLQIVPTFAGIGPSTQARFILVSADETNGGARTMYFHDGANLNWIVMQGVA